ncbi:MAG: helix-turn-helix transcriptional regulator [Clostridia bacterium]|nr:helix-turn-helix transcriptional regulator [Clostridia bacterium]
MNLNEKILFYRKKAGLSQEDLAQRIGVSRQAVSKWETGDSEPEVGKLLLLAETFDISMDWLLSREEISDDKGTAQSPPHSWVDSVPGLIGRLLRRYGWLFGVYVAVVGAGFSLIGALAKIVVRGMVSGIDGFFPDETIFIGDPQFGFDEGFSNLLKNNPVSIFGTAMIIFGIILIITGIVLAVSLKRRYSLKSD